MLGVSAMRRNVEDVFLHNLEEAEKETRRVRELYLEIVAKE